MLRARPLGEADRIVTLFTRELGKVDAVAKGIRRPKSHFAGRLEFANECALTMHRGRSLDVIVSAQIVRAPWQRLVEPARFAAAGLVAELIDAFCEPDLAMPETYDLLTGALAALETVDEPRALLPRFELRLLDLLGLAPPPDRCVRCTQVLGSAVWVDAQAGGLVDESCRERWRDLPSFDADDRENFRALAVGRGGTAPAARARPRVARAVDELVAHHLGRRPKAGANVSDLAIG